MENVLEKRQGIRHNCYVPIEGKRGTAFANSQTVDISRGGAGIIVKNYVPINTELAVEIDLAEDGDSIVAVGQVKWIRQVPGKSKYRLGISFANIEPDLKSRLSRYLKS